MPWFVIVLISVALEVLAYVLMPKPKQTPQAVQDLQAPTAEAGRPMPVVFGSMRVKSMNVLWYGSGSTNTYTYDGNSGGGK